MPAASANTRYPLTPHATSPRSAAERLVAEVAREGQGGLALTFRLSGDPAALVFPPPAAPLRTDGLWRHTCFEAFIAAADSPEYWEFNFSPSSAWAAYHFSGYRAGMQPVEEAPAPAIAVSSSAADFTLDVALDIGWLLRLRAGSALRLGLTAVVEDRTQGLSYWALKHAAEKPDFHRAESFQVALA
jgi:hypothetical protein